MTTSRRFKAVYVAITATFLLVAFGFAAAGIWVVALACLAMGGAMTAASRQMKVSRPPEAQPRDLGHDSETE